MAYKSSQFASELADLVKPEDIVYEDPTKSNEAVRKLLILIGMKV